MSKQNDDINNNNTSNNNLRNIAIILLAIALVSVTMFAVKNEKKEVAKQKPEKVYVGYDSEEPLENFSQEAAVKSLTKIINNVSVDVADKDRTINERLESLDDGKADMKDVLSKDVIDDLYLPEHISDKRIDRQLMSSSLLVYNRLIQDANKDTIKEDGITPVITEFDEIIYLDNKMKTAHIPLDIYIGNSTGIAFEMQYIDGNWQLNPYTATMSLHLMGLMDTGNNKTVPSKTPDK